MKPTVSTRSKVATAALGTSPAGAARPVGNAIPIDGRALMDYRRNSRAYLERQSHGFTLALLARW